MRIWAVLILIGGVLFSLSAWKKRSDESWEVCSLFSLKPHEATVGSGWFLTKGGMRNRDPLVCVLGECKKLSLDVFVPEEGLRDKTARTVKGTFRCPLENHNFSQYFFLRFFKRPLLVATRSRILEYEAHPNFIDTFSWEYRKKFPLVDALVLSVWKGTTSGFSDDFVSFYRLGGLSHVLAVSGTHVMILYFLLNKIFSLTLLFFPMLLKKRGVWLSRIFLLFLAGFLLCKYSPGNAPVYRVLFFLITVGWLQFKRWKSSPLQIVCSGVALLLLYEPGLIVSESFWLSGTGSLFLSLLRQGKILGPYFFAVFLIPLLMAPLVVFVFGQISLGAPFFSLFFSPLWDVVLIPIGYVCPFLGFWVGNSLLLNGFERFLQWISWVQVFLFPLVEKSQLVTVRLSFLEVSVLTLFLLFLFYSAVLFGEEMQSE